MPERMQPCLSVFILLKVFSYLLASVLVGL